MAARFQRTRSERWGNDFQPDRFAEVGDEARRAIHAGRAGATTANAWKSGGDKLKWFEAKALPPSELAAW
jgi:hypothetical protein